MLLTVSMRAAHAQARDSLTYRITIQPLSARAEVEARLRMHPGTVLALDAPSSRGSAGTSITSIAGSDDDGRPLEVRRTETGYAVTVAADSTVWLRYTLVFLHGVPDGSTGAGLDTARLYAGTRSLIIAPDPTSLRKSGARYPVVSVRVSAPAGWRVVAGWPEDDAGFHPAGGDELVGGTLAAAPDFRWYEGTAGGARWRLAVRGRRYFADSTLVTTIAAGLAAGAATLGPAPVTLVTYTADLGRKGRMSGSLQGTASIGLVWEPSEILMRARKHDLFHETLHLWFGGAMETERWWTEGVTDYLAARLLAGSIGTADDLAFLCFQSLRNYQAIEHKTRYSMTEEARLGIAGDNTELLVYRKGMLAGLALDAALRRSSHGERTLDDLSRSLLALAGHRGSRRVSEAEIHDAAVALGGDEVRAVWDRVVVGRSLLTEGDIVAALRDVTGRTFPVPVLQAKQRKALQRAAP
jgi:predicted metalloprotease with PDZ domain